MAAPSVIEISSSPTTQFRGANTSHRLPTVSASQALQSLQSKGTRCVSLGLPGLDSRLCETASNSNGGIECGKITELWGPSGAGKTAIALSTATSALQGGGTVLWVDAAAPLSDARLNDALAVGKAMDSSSSAMGGLDSFKHLHASTLSHLLAIVSRSPAGLISVETTLLVIDDLNILIDVDFPRQPFATSSKTEQQKWQSSRRYAILSSLVSSLNKLAVVNNLAVIVTTGCSTRMRPDSGLGAALAPGIGGTEWEAGIWNRLVIFRDFSGRLIGMQKSQGKSLISRDEIGETGRLFTFDISRKGEIQERQTTKGAEGAIAALAKTRISPVKPRKRTFDEIADSEDEDVDEYGWAEADDDALAAEGLGEDVPAAVEGSVGSRE